MRLYNFGSSLTTSSLSRQQVVSLSQSSCVSPVELTEGGGAKSYDREKARSSINHSIVSAIRKCIFKLGSDIFSISGINASLSSMQEILTSRALLNDSAAFEPTRAPDIYFSKIGRCAALSLSLLATLLLLSAYSCMRLSCIYQNSGSKKVAFTALLSRLQLKNAQLHTYRKKKHESTHT